MPHAQRLKNLKQQKGKQMKCKILGLKDYCKDCWHDFWFWFWGALWMWTQHRTFRCYDWTHNEGCYIKEGSLKHYIQQRKLTKGARK